MFSVDQCEVMQSHLQMMQVPRQQMDIFLAVKFRYSLSLLPRSVCNIYGFVRMHMRYIKMRLKLCDVTFFCIFRALATNPHTAELSDLAQAIVRIEVRLLSCHCQFVGVFRYYNICCVYRPSQDVNTGAEALTVSVLIHYFF